MVGLVQCRRARPREPGRSTAGASSASSRACRRRFITPRGSCALRSRSGAACSTSRAGAASSSGAIAWLRASSAAPSSSAQGRQSFAMCLPSSWPPAWNDRVAEGRTLAPATNWSPVACTKSRDARAGAHPAEAARSAGTAAQAGSVAMFRIGSGRARRRSRARRPGLGGLSAHADGIGQVGEGWAKLRRRDLAHGAVGAGAASHARLSRLRRRNRCASAIMAADSSHSAVAQAESTHSEPAFG